MLKAWTFTCFYTRCRTFANVIDVQLDASGIRKWEGAKKLSKQAARFWFTGLFFNVVAGFYTLYQLKQRAAALDKTQAEKAVESKKIEKYALSTSRNCISDTNDLIGSGTQRACSSPQIWPISACHQPLLAGLVSTRASWVWQVHSARCLVFTLHGRRVHRKGVTYEEKGCWSRWPDAAKAGRSAADLPAVSSERYSIWTRMPQFRRITCAWSSRSKMYTTIYASVKHCGPESLHSLQDLNYPRTYLNLFM